MIETKSFFVYGIVITSANRYVDFKEGAQAYSVELLPGRYTLSTIARELSRALNSMGLLSYACTINRTTRKITVKASGAFQFVVDGAPHAGSSAFPMLGFTSSKEGTSIESDLGIGKVYTPPRYLQDFSHPDHNLSAISESLNESGDGTTEIFSLGEKRLCEFNIDYITDNAANYDFIENESGMVAKTTDFLAYMTKKGPFDFIPDRANPSFFWTLVIEKNTYNAKGTGFRLFEMSGLGHIKMWETKLMTFRVVEI